MQALGYVEGRNIAFDVRYADGKVDRLPALAAELVAQRPAVIATFGDATGLAVKAATNTIPVVSMSEDLVRAKLVTDMRQPEGNITGVSIMGTELDANVWRYWPRFCPLAAPCFCLQTRPHIASPGRRSMQPRQRSGSCCAKPLSARRNKLNRPCARLKTRVRPGLTCCPRRCCLRYAGTSLASLRKLGLPTMYQWPEIAEEGGLIAYGPSLRGAFRQVTTLVDKILKGAKPSDIPVEQPTRFSLVINLKTANMLGLTIPPLTLLRADRAID